MEISVRQINIKSKHIRTLLLNGIVLVSHLNAFDNERLARKTKLSSDECEQILSAIKPKRPSYVIKASELMVRPFEKISTTIEDLDSALGGGIRCGQLTEISGEAGAGKSNLAAQIGTLINGQVLLIHTEGEGKLMLTIKRYKKLGDAGFLHVMNCSNEFELVETVNRLADTLDKMPDVKMIVIDSINTAFIQTDCELNHRFYTQRNYRITKMVKMLARIAWERRIAVLITNHVSWNPKLGETRPAMGRFWSHMCQTKIFIERKHSHRYVYITKGAINTPTIASYVISDDVPLKT